ncbi:MAG TPA: potassium transporter KefB [Bacteroidetes bacterium]|nr:potassium transporter KefB [Bacteroidota bacterium]
MEFDLLEEILIIFLLSTLVILLFQRIKIPTLLGFLITGILIGPNGISIVKEMHDIEILAEIGVVLLLFTIGIEFSFRSLIKGARTVLLGGSLQVFLTALLTYVLMRALGLPAGKSVFMGFLVALSSTAVVLKMIQSRGEVNTLYGSASVGILIFQDLIIVPMILFTPFLAGNSTGLALSLVEMLLKGLGLVGMTYVSAKYLVPKVLHHVARTGNRELFLIMVLLIGLAIAWLSSELGLSLALGAFLAGLAISESDYHHQAFGNIVPFRDIFTSFFFVSIGMMLDLGFVVDNPLLVLGIVAGVLLVKTFIAGMVAFLLGFPFRTTVMVGLALSQVGEFSFILSGIGRENGLISGDHYQLFLSVTIVTMALTPFILMWAPAISNLVMKLPLPEKLVKGLRPVPRPVTHEMKDHLLIIGMGMNGTNLARAAKTAGIRYVLLDVDADRVRKAQKSGEPAFYGDASIPSVLRSVGGHLASVVVAISDPANTYRITQVVNNLNPKAYIIVRTRYVEDVEDLYKLGADEVIPEEFETSVEIFARVLSRYLVPRDEIEKLIAEIRADGYDMFRSMTPATSKIADLKLHLPEIEITGFRVEKETELTGKTIRELRLRSQFGVTLLAIRRGEQTIPNPDASEKICEGDILYLMGDHKAIGCVTRLFLTGEETCD